MQKENFYQSSGRRKTLGTSLYKMIFNPADVSMAFNYLVSLCDLHNRPGDEPSRVIFFSCKVFFSRFVLLLVLSRTEAKENVINLEL